MSTEFATTDDPSDAPPPMTMSDPIVDDPKAQARIAKGQKPKEVVQSSYAGLSASLKAVKSKEDASLRDIIEALGEAGSYRIRVSRTEPDEARDATGKMVPTAGYLKTYEKEIDEEYLQRKYGGGTFVLEFKRRNAEGKYVLFTTRTIPIAGEPDTTNLPKSAQGVIAGGQGAPHAAEPASVVTKAMETMTGLLQDANARADRREAPTAPAHNPAMDALLDMMKAQVKAANEQVAELRREMAEARVASVLPPDTFKERMLDKMIDGDSARLQAVRMQYESELRTAKDNTIAEERRIREVFERDKQDLRMAHERELQTLRTSNESAMASLRSSHEIQLSAAKMSFETQTKLLESENRRLDRDNADLRVEVKDLRAKKDKTLLEQVKDVETIKEALGVGDDEKTNVDKVIEVATNPAAWEAVGNIFKKKDAAATQAAAAQAAAAQQQQAQPQREQVFRAPNGQRFKAVNGELVPVKRARPPQQPQRPRTQVPATAAGAPAASGEAPAEGAAEQEQPVEEQPEVQLPTIDPDDLRMMVSLFESAFGGGQEPAVVAQGIRARMTEEVLAYLRDQITEHGDRGVDMFVAKVVKLPSNSSLATQAGRNWIRKVGKELVGAE